MRFSHLKGWCCLCFFIHCSVWAAPAHVRVIGHGMPDVDLDNAIYEVPVQPGVSYQDLVDSLKSLSEGMNFVNPANFPIGDHMKQRGQDPQGIKEVRTFCNLSMGTEIILDHPEFLVFAPCRLAIYEKPDVHGKRQLYLGLDRPTHDLKNIKHPTARAQASAQQLENALIELMEKARRGDF
ncbi:DUF302 domain-containing protein [Methylophilus sp. DW102]|uniref:DUF302 domain-containing protein n=1 Tax=Methylophilus sp. DW102 TaxID=3095607 RepID=UPI00308A9483|nr:DUF302 domain-containing protein [Methylophilus sp. DW102]